METLKNHLCGSAACDQSTVSQNSIPYTPSGAYDQAICLTYLIIRVVGSHIKSEISSNDSAGLAAVMPETSFPCGKVAAIMFSMHEFQRSTPQAVVHSSLKLNWVNSNRIKSQWLADSAIVNPGGDIHIPGGVLRATCILFVNVTNY